MACISVKAASSPDRSEKDVKPTMSVKRTVTCRRSASMELSQSVADFRLQMEARAFVVLRLCLPEAPVLPIASNEKFGTFSF